MTRQNNISQLILRMGFRQAALRMALSLALLLGVALGAGAQTAWDGTTATKPAGTGTSVDPYVIATAENLHYLAKNISNYNAANKSFYFVQTADIDLNNKPWTPIGKNGSAFFGNYDGQGHTIKNMYINPNDTTELYTFGLFGWLKADVKNLVIDHATISHEGSTTKTFGSKNDIKIGILCGVLGAADSRTIQNIIVRNSRITDENFTNTGYAVEAHSYAVGGIIGDINGGAAYNGADEIKSNIKIKVTNIYAEVNITLQKIKISSGQYNVGGVLGRLRSGGVSCLPQNVIFTGDISVAKAPVGPIFGFTRYKSQVGSDAGYDAYLNGYRGSFADNTKFGEIDPAVVAKMYYTGYSVNGQTIEDKAVDGTVFATHYTYTYGGETVEYDLLTLKEVNESGWTGYNVESVKMFQGVNRGTYLKPEDVEAKINEISEDVGFKWIDSPFGLMMRDKEIRWISVEQSDKTFTATLHSSDGTELLTTGYKFKWYLVDGNQYKRLLGETETNTFDYITNKSEVLMAVLCDEDGNEVLDKSMYRVFGYVTTTNNMAYEIVTTKLIDAQQTVTITADASVTFSSELRYAETDELIESYSSETQITLPILVKPVKLVVTLTDGVVTSKQEVELDYIANATTTSPTAGQLPEVKFSLYNQRGEEVTASNGLTLEWTKDDPFLGSEMNADNTVFKVRNITSVDRHLVASCTDSKGNVLSSEFTITRATINIAKTGDKLTATFWNFDGTGLEGAWSWRGIKGDITGAANEGEDLGCSTNTCDMVAESGFDSYRAAWVSTDGNTVLYGYFADVQVIYVYSEENTINYNNGKVYSARKGDFNELLAMNYPDGRDDNDGRTPNTAVKTMKRAYELLDKKSSAKDNIIVIMGYRDDNSALWKTNGPATGRQVRLPAAGYEKNATITGAYGEISDGILKLQSSGNEPKALSGATILQNITLEGGSSELNLYAYLHDLTFANGVKIYGYGDLSSTNGILPKTTAPAITIVGGYHNYDLDYLPLPESECPSPSNAVPGMQTLTFQSGNIGRIIASARNDISGHTNSFNTFGSPNTPHHVTVNVAIKHTKDENGNEKKNEYCPGKKYDFDIGMLVGGQTDGTTFAETNLNVFSGTIGRFVAGNISFGRSMGDEHPDDGFYGSTTLTLEGGEIMELVGGSLGRATTGNSSRCEAYFYGRAILNINGGIINSNLYAVGTGGVVGFADDKGNHTNDNQIPYIDKTSGQLLYGDYQTVIDNGKMPVLTLLDGTPLDLAKSYCEININAGVINGNVYGGGYGYTDQIVDAKINNANEQSGNLYGNSYININGGTIKGNVYGGGAGSDEFYNRVSAANKSKYTNLANIFGDTHVTITGGVIEGKVFAGSQGIAGFPEMATVNGSTNLTIANEKEAGGTERVPIINNNVYGGSELGRVTGDTHVTITGGAIGNCIFGGSEGIAADVIVEGTVKKLKTTAFVDGETVVKISGGTYFTEEHIAKISPEKRIDAKDRTFNIYGGGYNNCIIEKNTNVEITNSLLTSHLCLIEPDPTDPTKKRTFDDCVNDRTYRKFSVYGAGRGELTDVKGNANLTVNIEGGASIPSAKPDAVASGQQFFMIAGGGMAGHVWGNTNVKLDGSVFARRIYGGGMYGNVLGDANMTVRRGAYYGVFGGGLLGNVKGNAYLQIGTKAGESITVGGETKTFSEIEAAEANRNLYVYDNVYGGNDVSGCTGYETTGQLWNDGNYDTFVRAADKLTMTEEQKSHHYLFEHWSSMNDDYDPNKKDDEQPYYRHLIRASEKKGVNMKIYGGKILGDVFGAGNGNHTGYYVPNSANSEHYNAGQITRMMFYEGLPYHYRVNKKDENSFDNGKLRSVLDPQIRQDYGLYEYRPRVGKVVMYIGGNSEKDRVEIGGDVFGGGHACTIGMYDPTRDVLTDPLRFEGGGSLKMNFGSHVTVKNAVYMGSRGRIIGEQTVLVKGDDADEHYATTTLNSDYDYHYYDKNQNKYLLGFPNTLEGRMRFHAYMQLVNMDATTELAFDENAEDMRWGSFFAGGARGSMTKLILPKTHSDYDPIKTKPYEYTLPAGLTIETRVVGGSEDADITYYDYKDKTGPNAFTELDMEKPLFTFYGGIVYDEHNPTTGRNFGGGRVKWHDESYDISTDPQKKEDEKMVGDESPRGSLVVMKLNVNCQFDPQKAEANNADWDDYKNLADKKDEVASDGEQYWGGLVYGGCYHSGITNGSVEVSCTETLLGKVDADFKDFRDYLSASSLRRNVARVYGGGFGENSTILGNTKVTLDGNFKGFNVFGGGMMGSVTGGTEIEVKGNSLVYNAVYGGGMLGDVGKAEYTEAEDKDLYAKGSHIRLQSGGVDRVYGGAFMGDVYGGTHITANDGGNFDPSSGGRPIRLFAGTIYGGNDITGTVHKDTNNKDISGNDNLAKGLSTYIDISETPLEAKKSYYLSQESTVSGEGGKYYAGFPIIGTVYGAGNGNMSDYIKGVNIDRENDCYDKGMVHIANGNGADYQVFDMSEKQFPLPNVDASKINITGGTIINVYGGGSMCTTKERNEVIVNFTDTVARAAFLTERQNPMIWGVMRLFEDLQKQEVTTQVDDKTRFSYQIYRVFGGNNLMDMAIQPNLQLTKGNIFSVYSGGNFGKMTYPEGLSLTINSPDIRIASIYGGGRVGDIVATNKDTKKELIFGENKYGATLNIENGVIGDVYGGNNVAGNVRNGTNVNIKGAISGNVYGSGNGNYIYYYNYKDEDEFLGQHIIDKTMISEGYDESYGGRFFILPFKSEFAAAGKATDEDKLLAINSYRPNVNKAFLNIQGTEESKVYVLGNVYCGGNSSTVLYDSSAPDAGKIKFEIGDYVMLGGVFFGSNGEGLANPFNITYLQNLNGIESMGTKTTAKTGDTELYPNLLSLYMRAAEVTALPSEFKLPTNTKHAYIGNFTVGGNRGSMMTDKTIKLTLPKNLTIFGRIVGGSYDARVDFHGATAMGGMPKELSEEIDPTTGKRKYTDKVHLEIKSKFVPKRMVYNETNNTVSLVNDGVEEDGVVYYTDDRCNIFGGCYTSGKTVGGIRLDLYSDVLNGVNRQILKNNINERRTVFAITGAGYGPLSEVEGDTHVRLMPTPVSEIETGSPVPHPSIGTIFGGAHNGKHIGNSTVEIRDGLVFSNLYAGSRAALKYGSSEVIVGYPKYYICKTSGEFVLDRADKYSYVAQAQMSGTDKVVGGKTFKGTNADGKPVIKQKVKYKKGDIVAANVVEQITGIVDGSEIQTITLSDYFEEHFEQPEDVVLYGSKWDNISINIGDNSNMDVLGEEFFGGGGIYGGGHALNESATSYSGKNTMLAYTAENNPEKSASSPSIGYGGNSTIIVGDEPTFTNEHISIGTGRYVEVKIPQDGDKIGTYALIDGKFVHQASGKPSEHTVNGEPYTGKYYRMETDGGIYGDGRRNFVENFRAVDISGYGYAKHSPQSAKLINTFQRIDLLSLNDCCLQLQGAKDYATNSIDATIYSIARIGEMRMNSTLTGALIPSTEDAAAAGNMSLTTPKSRNYMGFFNNVHYLGAIYSSTAFTDDYHKADGTVKSTSYKDEKNSYISAYDAATEKTTEVEKTFKKRNLGTAPNMIGINNGYTLKLSSAFTTSPQTGSGSGASSGSGGTSPSMLSEEVIDNSYYGPIVGVVEVKLLTLATDEGGGYIYAFNQHADKDANDKTKGKTFLEETGNFVYPSAINDAADNYIVDDCYPLGYYSETSHATDEEAHYWYVTGHHYYFNTTLTAYTYNQNISFKLNNSDNLILLSGISKTVEAAQKSIVVESIEWEDHVDAGYECALTNDINDGTNNHTTSQYQMFLTISDNPGNDYDLSKTDGAYSNTGNAFVAKIPNGNTGGAIESHNTYTSETPLLGIRLYDTDNNNQKPQFYKEHLSLPDNLVIKIKALESGEAGTSSAVYNFYTIKLNVVYLQGPYIAGKVKVENCALPGEYIYANTEDVEMEMDESLTVTGKKWYLYPRERQTNTTNEYYKWDTNNPVEVSEYVMNDKAGDVNYLRLPARFYQHDWKLGYCVVVNGQEFPLEDNGDGTNRLTVHNYHRMSTVAAEVKQGTTYGYDLDLDLVGGALVYIEDDKDFEIFTKYVNYCNGFRSSIAEDEKGYVKNPSGAESIRFVLSADVNATGNCQVIDEFRGILNGNGHTITFNSDYEGENFILRNYGTIREVGFISNGGDDGLVSNNATSTSVVKFNRGNIENSYYFYYPEGTLGQEIDFSGTVADPKDDELHVYSTLIGVNQKTADVADAVHDFDGKSDNCYQNTNKQNADGIVGVQYRANDSFHNGLVAYNLNQEYLKARQMSKDDDKEVHEKMKVGDYLYRYYADGEYRYAYPRSAEHPEGIRLAENFGVPNYEDNLSNGLSMHITDETEAHDKSRWFKNLTRNDIVVIDERGNIKYNTDGSPQTASEGYFPIYLYDATFDGTNNPEAHLADHSDFIFFGQTLTTGADRDFYPVRINNSNRVYRAGGFYGDRVDNGFHFNRDAWAMESSLTAIDFTGYYDEKDSDGTIYKEEWQENKDGATLLQSVYYPPVLDLPGGDHQKNLHNLVSFHVDSNVAKDGRLAINDHSHVTKNLLVYTPEVSANQSEFNADDNDRLFSQLHYTRMQRWGEPENETNQNDIIGHHLMQVNPAVGASYFSASGGLFHLVDLQDFNAPIEFFVLKDPDAPVNEITGRSWILRQPEFYAKRDDGKTFEGFTIGLKSWKSLALPFTANRVWAVNSGNYEEKYSRGQITHFYGSNPQTGITHHDYWLRGLVDAASDGCGKSDNVVELVDFARPGKSYTTTDENGTETQVKLFEVKDDNGKDEQKRGTYHYESDWFVKAYGTMKYNTNFADYYNDPDDVSKNGIDFPEYCYITKNAPYIISFPGEDYYEFDLSGKFYNEKHGIVNGGCNPQEIMYEFTVEQMDEDNNFDELPAGLTQGVRIPVTDVYDAVRRTSVTDADGQTISHVGTFARIADADLTENMYVLNPKDLTQIDVHGDEVTLPVGSVFVRVKDMNSLYNAGLTPSSKDYVDYEEILPFRTYITIEPAGGAPAVSPKPFVVIGDGTRSAIEGDYDEEKAEEKFSGVNLYVMGHDLVVTSDHDFQLLLYGYSGQLFRRLPVRAGKNVFKNLNTGVYIALGKKFVVR